MTNRSNKLYDQFIIIKIIVLTIRSVISKTCKTVRTTIYLTAASYRIDIKIAPFRLNDIRKGESVSNQMLRIKIC